MKRFGFIQDAMTNLHEAVLYSRPTIDPLTHMGADKESTREFILGFHNYASMLGRELAHFLNTEGSKSLLDVGCGPGTYAFSLGTRNKDLELYLIDNPDVLEIAKEIEGRYPLKNRVHYMPLDVMKEAIPGKYDIILVSNLLVGMGEEGSRDLIKRLSDALNKGGSLVIQAQFLREDRPEKWPIFLDLEILCTTTNGRNHSAAETEGWLKEAGFRNIEFSSMTVF